MNKVSISVLLASCLMLNLAIIIAAPEAAPAKPVVSNKPAAAQADHQTQLFWRNGDSLVGTVVSATSEHIVWETPFFAEPLQIKLSAIAGIQFASAKLNEESEQTFRIMLRNGDVLFGSLKSVDEKTLVIESNRHGEVVLLQEEIRTLRRINSKQSTFLGPHGIKGWKQSVKAKPKNNIPVQRGFGGGINIFPVAVEIEEAVEVVAEVEVIQNVAPMIQVQQLQPLGFQFRGLNGVQPNHKTVILSRTGWYELSDGRISTQSSSEIFHEFNFPDNCEIEVVLESKAVPDFSLILGQNKNDCLRLETWEDTLVALSGYDFVELSSLKKDQHKIHLHLYLNKAKKQVSIYSHSGKKLGEVNGSQSKSSLNGITLLNEGKNLTLSYLRIDPWSGDYPKPLRAGESRIQLNDGTVQYGEILEVNQKEKTIVFGEADSKATIPLEKVSSITLSEGIEKKEKDEQLQITWLDGGLVSGTLEKISDNRVAVKTGYAKNSVNCLVTGINNIQMPISNEQKPPEVTADRVIFPGGTLRGELTIENDSDIPIKWKPVGGINASELSSKGKAKFIRGNKHPDLQFDVTEFPDVLFLKNNDVLPCRIEKLTEQAIEVAFPFADSNRIANEQVKAIEFASSKRGAAKDFTDKKWTKTGSGKLTKESVLLSGNATVANSDILTGDDIQFQLDWAANQYAKLTLYLNTDNVLNTKQQNSKTVTAIEFMTSQENVMVTKGKLHAQGHNHFWGVMNNGQNKNLRCPGATAKVRLLTRDGAVHVFLNGKQVAAIPLNRNGAQEKGLFISSNYMGSHGGNIRNRTKKSNGIAQGFRISKFEINSVAGSSVKQYILEEARKRTLMIPRFRREDPPTHVIIAPNGDLLRGRLLGVDQQQITFESQLETFRFERSRVASIIWLAKLPPKAGAEENPEEEKPKQELVKVVRDPSEIQLRLSLGYSLSMKPLKAASDKLNGHSKTLGKCSIPAASIKELVIGDMEAEAYDVFAQWIPHSAPEPKWDLPENEEGNDLVGTIPKDFELPMLDGTTFKLSDHTEKVVVLDFWATWCGPCVMALPGYIEATDQFDSKKVLFVAVNQREASQLVRKFLKGQELSPAVALDGDGEIATQFGVSGIPHTVVISPGGTIELVKVGFSPTAAQEMKQTIEKILDGTWERKEARDENQQPPKPASDEPAL